MHKRLLVDVQECVSLSAIQNKITAVIPTYNAPIESLMWAIFSLLCRTDPKDSLEHIICVVNGPDRRTGDPTLQNQKQAFLEELRDLKWKGKDMPLTVIRAWSRVGHTQAIEMAIPWVHTDAYLLMHDDVILLRENWLKELRQIFYDDDQVAIAYAPPLLMREGITTYRHNGKWLIDFPHLHSAFLLCKKSIIENLGCRWIGYFVPSEFHLEDKVKLDEFLEYHGHRTTPPQTDEPYHYISHDIGTWVYHRVREAGFRLVSTSEDMILHFAAASWGGNDNYQIKRNRHAETIDALEREITAVPEYKLLYDKYHSGFMK